MSFSSWLRNRTSKCTSDRPATSRPAARFRPQLESLDDRLVPSTLTVMNNLDSGAGSLRAELGAANPGDTVNFDPGLAGQTILLTSDELAINKSLTIQGPGASLLTISGGNTWRVFEVYGSVTAGPTVQLSGLTITGGKAHALRTAYDGDGGGIVNDNGGTLTISGCVVSNNHTDFRGGGVANVDGTLMVTNSTLSGNTAVEPYEGGQGGAVYSIGHGTAALTGCTLSNNTAGFGGAVYNAGTTMAVSGCTLTGNRAAGAEYGGGQGGAIFNYTFTTTTTVKTGHTTTTTTTTVQNLTVSNSTFSGNYVLNHGFPTYSLRPIAGPWINGGGDTFK